MKAPLLPLLAAVTGLILGTGCGQNQSPPDAPAAAVATSAAAARASTSRPPDEPVRPAETFEQQEARLDATVWKDEVLAHRHEQTFVKLWDALRAASNKVSVLAAFDLDEIILPRPVPMTEVLPLGIVQQRFDASRPLSLQKASWSQTLSNLFNGGWRLEMVEWYHEKFIPPRDGTNAWSEFSFDIYGQRLTAKARFVMSGHFEVDWEAPSDAAGPARVKRLKVTRLKVLERTGPPAFTVSAMVTPNPPERQGEMVNMHPLIVMDLNSDKLEDIVMGGVNQVFVNEGEARFKPMEFVAESVFKGSSDAGVVADFNGDGILDFITAAKQGALTNRLVIYPGDGKVPFSQPPVLASETARFSAPSVMTAGDIDGDGDLDLWIGQYKPPYKGGQLPTPYYDSNDGYPSFLMLNDGKGRFETVTSARGLDGKRFRRTLAGSFADLDGDHDLDLVTINDYAGVDLYYNDGQGRFTDVTERLYNRHLFGMGHAVADFNRDGELDLYAIGMSVPTVRRLEFMGLKREEYPDRNAKRLDMGYGNRAYILKEGKWQKPEFADQVARTGWSWGTSAFDFDNNGWLDLYVANGHISGESAEDYDSHIWTHDIYMGSSREDPKLLYYFDKPFRGINTGKTSSNGYQKNVFFMDQGANQYVNVAYLMGVAHESDFRAVVSADLNNDGRQDLVLTEGQWFKGPHTGRNRLWVHLNELKTTNNWIGIKLNSRSAGVATLGAKIFAEAGGRTHVHQVISGDSYESQHPPIAHFGLGGAGQVDRIWVRWSNGTTNRLEKPTINQYHYLSPE